MPMTEEMNVSEATAQTPPKEKSKPAKTPQGSLQNLISTLKSLKDDVGQIVELSSEEKALVAAFFAELLKLMQPLAPTMPVSTSALPGEMGEIVQANIDPTGHLMISYQDGQAELKDLSEEENRDLMITVVEDVIPKFKQLTSARKQKIENRVNFLSSVTKELQSLSQGTAATAQ